MSATPTLRFFEETKSRQMAGTREDPEVTTMWKARGPFADETAVYRTALASVPFIFNHPLGWTLYRQDPVSVSEVAHDVWDIAVQYKKKRQEGDWDFSCQVSGGTLRIKQSAELISRYKTADAAHIGTIGEPFRIGQNGDNVEGADIIIPSTRFSFSFKHPNGELTIPYCIAISDAVGTVNSTAWGSFPEATALFMSFSGSDGRLNPATATYDILYSKGVTGKTIRDMVGIDKDGHHFLDVTYEDEIEAGEFVKQPRYVHIHRIYEESDLGDILPFTPS